MDALTFLEKSVKGKRQPFYVLTGEESFLRRQVLARLQPMIIGNSEPAFAVANFPGDKLDFSVVRNELSTLPFLSQARLVIVNEADKFVTANREALEKYLSAPCPSGVLILEVKSFPATTRLAKALPDEAIIACVTPKSSRLVTWCSEWAKSEYEKKLPRAAADLLVQLVGDQMGVLDSELLKLAIYAGDNPSIEARDVDQLVGRSQAANVFRIMDFVGEGKITEAMTVLAELFEEGQEPLKIVGAFAFQLRRLAKAGRLIRNGVSPDEALARAEIKGWGSETVKKQMRHLKWSRIDKLFDWLLEMDLGMKGGSPLPEKILLERFVIRMARTLT